jgi:hypothetical protein
MLTVNSLFTKKFNCNEEIPEAVYGAASSAVESAYRFFLPGFVWSRRASRGPSVSGTGPARKKYPAFDNHVGNDQLPPGITLLDEGISFISSTAKYQDNQTAGVTAAFSGGTDLGGNN